MSDRKANRQIISWIMSGLVAWGLYLAAGDYLQNHNLLRSLTTIACVAIFLGIWLTALAVRRAREVAERDAVDEETQS